MRSDTRHVLWMTMGSFGCLFMLIAYSSTGVLPWFAPFLYALWGMAIVYWTPSSSSFGLFLSVAILLRGMCIGSELVWSDDLYRYLWEGKLVLEGGNPYLSPPNAFTVEDGIRELVNHPSIPSVYPPLAQYIFAMQSWLKYDPSSVQFVSAIADLGTACALWVWLKERAISKDGAWLYALHPLPIIETAWSGHLESLAVCTLAWGLIGYQRWGRWIWLAGGWIKLFPFVFLFFIRRWKKWQLFVFCLLSAGMIHPFWDMQIVQGLQTYARHWSYNSSLYGLLTLFVPNYARLLCGSLGMILIGVIWFHWLRKSLPIERAILGLGMTVVLCSPTVHPWYALWVMVPMVFVHHHKCTKILGLWCSLIPLTYVSIFTLDPVSGEWSPPLWPTLISYLIPSGLWLWMQYRKARP